jgi:hypothetical protein
MRLPRGVVGLDRESKVVFVEDVNKYSAGKRFGFKALGEEPHVFPVGRIYMLQFVDNPVYPKGCSPNYGADGEYETARHCVVSDVCRVVDRVEMSDGNVAYVTMDIPYKACKKWTCWVFSRFLTRYGYMWNKCVEEYDNVTVSRGNDGKRPDLILFAGSSDGRLALFVPGLTWTPREPPFRVAVQSMDYYENQVKTWDAKIGGIGIFLVEFGEYTLPFRAYYVYPTPIMVKPGFSGSNAFVVT